MSDDPKPTKGELILSRKASLAIKKTGLVKRGLELVSGLKKHNLKVLITDADDNSGKSIFQLIKKAMGDEYNITYMATHYADEIVELAKNNEFDIFILYTNNVIFPLRNIPLQERINQVRQLATYLKMTYRKPLVALTGCLDIPDYYLAAAQAGADLNFFGPLRYQDVEAIKSILANSS